MYIPLCDQVPNPNHSILMSLSLAFGLCHHYIGNGIAIVIRFAKRILSTHSLTTDFSLPFVSYINGPAAHVFNTAEGWTVCFHSSLFLKPVWCPQVLRWLLNGPIFPWQADSWLWMTTRLADQFGHGFSCTVWHVEVKLAPMEVISLFLVKTQPLLASSWLPAHPPPSHPIGVLVVLAMPVKNYLKWREIQLAIHCTVDTVNYFE